MNKSPRKIVVKPEQVGRIDRVVQALTGLSRSRTRALFEHQRVSVNGSACASDFAPVKAGDVVEVNFDPHNLLREKPKQWHDPTFKLVYEDEHLLVVDKAAHALTVPTDDMDETSSPGKILVEAVEKYLKRYGRNQRAYVVQRLDRGTSGLLVIARTDIAYQRLRRQFEQHSPKREYLAILAGLLAPDQGVYRTYLKTGKDLSRYSTSPGSGPEAGGELAITHFRVERRTAELTLVRCRLETGRRNQIRVHFAEAGHPILGDPRYKRDLARHPRWHYRGRLALHAAVLAFKHPDTGEEMQWESPMPREFTLTLGSPRNSVPQNQTRE